LFDLLTFIRLTDKILGKKPKFKKVIPNPVPLSKSPTPFNDNFNNLKNIIKSEKSYNNIKYLIGNNKDNSNNSINFRNSITFTTNLFIVIFKNCKKTYR